MKSKQANQYIVDTSQQEIILSQMVVALWQFAMPSYKKQEFHFSCADDSHDGGEPEAWG